MNDIIDFFVGVVEPFKTIAGMMNLYSINKNWVICCIFLKNFLKNQPEEGANIQNLNICNLNIQKMNLPRNFSMPFGNVSKNVQDQQLLFFPFDQMQRVNNRNHTRQPTQ